MRKTLFILFLILASFGVMERARAFSLAGPAEPWQVLGLGYGPPVTDTPGPMNLGEEYRWNIPVIYYGYDESFINYFGNDGIRAIEQAIAILNRLPPVSRMSRTLEEFPLNTTRVNYDAQAQGLTDLKSTALGVLTARMGLNSPENWVWCLRGRVVVGNPPITNYSVIQRNFDPVSLTPTPYINGALYTYTIGEFQNPNYADALEVLVDPLTASHSVVGTVTGSTGITPGTGEFFVGLTRDDIGGLRYLYTKLNKNVENVLPGVTGRGGPFSPSTTGTTAATNTAGGGAVVGGRMTAADSTFEPSAGTGAAATGFTDVSLRPGLEKIRYKRVRFESRLGQFVAFTNTYSDYFITNGVLRSQSLRRAVTTPDILFTAEDLGVIQETPVTISESFNWDNNNNINGQAPLNGPGVVVPQITVRFSKIGPFFENSNPGFISEANNNGMGFRWGFFDGSTNAPIVFPRNEFQF